MYTYTFTHKLEMWYVLYTRIGSVECEAEIRPALHAKKGPALHAKKGPALRAKKGDVVNSMMVL